MVSFIDLCFLGLFDFASINGRSFNSYFYFMIILIFITGYFIYKDKKNITNYYVLAFYSMAVPLFDFYHTYLSFLAFMILVLFKIKKDIIKPELFIIGIIILEIILKIIFTEKIIYPNKINHFEYRYLDYNVIELTNEVNKFLEDNKDEEVIILSGCSYYFRLVNDMKITHLDLLNAGNFGYSGSDKILKEIKKKRNAIFLVDEGELLPDHQYDKQAINYVINNGKKIGSVSYLDIYVFDDI